MLALAGKNSEVPGNKVSLFQGLGRRAGQSTAIRLDFLRDLQEGRGTGGCLWELFPPKDEDAG